MNGETMLQTEKVWIQTPLGIPSSMVTAYVHRCLAGLSAAKAALMSLDHSALRVYGHRMKGSGGGYGIPRLTELGAGIEDAARKGDAAGLQNEFAELEIYLGRLEVLPDQP
jgi:HPt (histidine-containing phosphotransfer) domain-containing protein